ncbi:histidinol dehydrogenase [Candidatus Bathyarchaeota archaeon]|nr:histidinol dehydrogenase [Candidatus Bathyarchaeota archaeon]
MNDSQLVKVWRGSTLPPKWIERRRAIGWENTIELEKYVKSIINEIRERGDAALLEFTKKFDHANLTPENLCVTKGEIEDAYSKVSREQVSALEFMKDKIENFERQLLKQIDVTIDEDIRVRILSRPIQSIGCYVPGGEAVYPSTLIMTVTPANVAQVPRIVVCSPPSEEGLINSLTLVAADICEVDEIYKIGGAQAIAALAYGTESIIPVKKIVGPGNKFVTMAKILVSRNTAIDMPAGPSEILVLADETADPRIVALDMISQAEHSTESVVGLVTTSKELTENVIEELKKLVPKVSRGKFISEALSKHGFIIIYENIEEAIDFSNKFAPEHLEVITKKPIEVVNKISSAGLILMGPYAPVSASDYCIGTNHVLPTSGFGHVFSGLSVLDFVKRINCIEGSKKGLLKLRENIRTLTESEGLPNHFLAVDGRFKT